MFEVGPEIKPPTVGDIWRDVWARRKNPFKKVAKWYDGLTCDQVFFSMLGAMIATFVIVATCGGLWGGLPWTEAPANKVAEDLEYVQRYMSKDKVMMDAAAELVKNEKISRRQLAKFKSLMSSQIQRESEERERQKQADAVNAIKKFSKQ